MRPRTFRVLVVLLLAVTAAASCWVAVRLERSSFRDSFVTIPR